MLSHFVLKNEETPATLWIHVRCLNIYKTEMLLSDFTTEVSKLMIACCTFCPIYAMLGPFYSKQTSFISLKEMKNYHDRQ